MLLHFQEGAFEKVSVILNANKHRLSHITFLIFLFKSIGSLQDQKKRKY